MSRVNYRNLPPTIRAQAARPKPRKPIPAVTTAQPPVGAIGAPATGGAVAGLVNRSVTGQPSAVPQPAAGKPVSPVLPVNQVLPPAGGPGTVGTALRGSTGFRSRRK